jgi:membrane protein DedA with SNARE-associated domain
MVNLPLSGHGVSIADQIQYFESLSYLGIFLVVILSGYIIPVPEDIIMLIVGYIAAIHVVHLIPAIAISVIAITTADFGIYYLSLHGFKLAVSFEKRIKANIFNWYIGHMKERTFFVMLFSRFIPGLRIVSSLVAGMVKISPLKFFFYSFCSACIYAPFMILIGFFFHSKITPLLSAVESTKHVLFIIFVIAAGVGMAIFARKKFFT